MSTVLGKVSARRVAEKAREDGNAEFLALSRVTRTVLEKFARRIQRLELAVVALALVAIAEGAWMLLTR